MFLPLMSESGYYFDYHSTSSFIVNSRSAEVEDPKDTIP